MTDRRETEHDRTEALAYRIYLQEKSPLDHAQDHWKRAEDGLRNLDETPSGSHSSRVSANRLEHATLQCPGRPAIGGLAFIYRDRPEDGGKFYPGNLQNARLSLELPATLYLDATAETFNLVRLQSGTEGEACFNISFG